MVLGDDSLRFPLGEAVLLRGKVYIWRASLNQPCECMHGLAQTLSEDEVVRAERFRFERDRRRFIVCRGTLRLILSRYLGTDPGEIRFRYGERGKPYLAAALDDGMLRFNLSHSHELALYAFIYSHEVGIDLEYVRPLQDLDKVAAHIFSSRENALLQSLPEGQRLEAFYACWTRKEAYLKATGDGLAWTRDQFDVPLDPERPINVLHIEEDSREAARWSVQPMVPEPGYVGAVVVEKCQPEIVVADMYGSRQLVT